MVESKVIINKVLVKPPKICATPVLLLPLLYEDWNVRQINAIALLEVLALLRSVAVQLSSAGRATDLAATLVVVVKTAAVTAQGRQLLSSVRHGASTRRSCDIFTGLDYWSGSQMLAN